MRDDFRRSNKSAAQGALALVLSLSLTGLSAIDADARDQWQIDRPDPSPTSLDDFLKSQGGNSNNNAAAGMGGHPGNAPDQSFSNFLQAKPGMPGMVPSTGEVGTDFWKSFSAGRLQMGTVLTGIIDSDLKSNKSERGDVFSILLEHGYVNNGQVVIPPGSRILGTVVEAHSSKEQRIGMPGKVTIGLQTLVFPDGRSIPFQGFIDHNPAHDQLSEPKLKMSGFGLSDYGQSLKGMVGSFGSGIGWVQNRRLRGKEFEIEAGQMVAVRVNRTIDLSTMGGSGGAQAAPGLSASGAGGIGQPPNAAPLVPGLVAPQYGALPNNYPQAVPGLAAPPFSPAAGQTSIPGLSQAAVSSDPPVPDPNYVFKQQLSDPTGSIPDPF
ncbi:MAG: hypothetical protein K8F91_13965 [Candidatus Obscuribacterales bacterium]|nr:hypothetical protein [Candidatus Obscuribacterales bacterium]